MWRAVFLTVLAVFCVFIGCDPKDGSSLDSEFEGIVRNRASIRVFVPAGSESRFKTSKARHIERAGAGTLLNTSAGTPSPRATADARAISGRTYATARRRTPRTGRTRGATDRRRARRGETTEGADALLGAPLRDGVLAPGFTSRVGDESVVGERREDRRCAPSSKTTTSGNSHLDRDRVAGYGLSAACSFSQGAPSFQDSKSRTANSVAFAEARSHAQRWNRRTFLSVSR